jgi:hypothetical protein
LPDDQSFFSEALVKALVADPQIAIGDAMASALRQVPMDSPARRDVVKTFLLFGDPAMHLR